MSRPHTYLKMRKTEYALARMLVDLDRQKADPDFQLDLEFKNQLNELMEEFGFSSQKVIDLILEFNKLKASRKEFMNDDLQLESLNKIIESECKISVFRNTDQLKEFFGCTA
ncbi:hypothetical protein BV326_04942 [Pseudomonas syringae pv. actinidiae]|uniref:hypothetical protein n=1 Tax=Pseudomonas syringae TaxID=317 RepID=UPI000A2206DA|nr:hypothetical protein [Pseudomonas syringae]OSR66124.1 hypothetical protein BV326_04942 [Pseudomonas syringae pv. actinidiae]